MALSRLRVWAITATAVWLSLLAMDSKSWRVSAQTTAVISASPLTAEEAELVSAYSPPSPDEVTLFDSWLSQDRSTSSPPVPPQILALFGGPGDTGVTSATPGVVAVGRGAGGQVVMTGGGRRRRRRRSRSLLTVEPALDGDQLLAPPHPSSPLGGRRELQQSASSPSPAPGNTTGTSNAPDSSGNAGPPPPPPPPSSSSPPPSSSSSSTPGVDAVVAKDGSGQFTTVQAAVNNAPGNKRYVVFVKRGTYVEKVLVDKAYVTLRGEGPYLTTLTYSDTNAATGSTSASASVSVTGNFFSAEDIEFANGAPRPDTSSVTGQAVAIRITGDQAAFYNCRFIGYQDTLYSLQGRHYFKQCYIRGSVDFIFGDGTAMFLDSDLFADVIDKGGYLTAQNRGTAKSTTGFVFLRCKVNGNGLVYLGRPWGKAARTVFAYTYLSEVVQPAGWDTWGKTVPKKMTVFYGEYKNTGPGAEISRRVKWSRQLTAAQAKQFLTVDFIDGKSWIPKSGLQGLTDKE
ncbi:hypothetical protein CBR_g39202 [Chara braunii]|uniref:Pectinesterase n=1 Tax=Chara braunii TaxID=69332 RepID=A0A388LR69_CHABU|nr:hypothetical protein CBR_g39202 [Chara braunii]|eukprot:GBG84826.1 hypothetical protein CBR_g39202 [Chara braunii]